MSGSPSSTVKATTSISSSTTRRTSPSPKSHSGSRRKQQNHACRIPRTPPGIRPLPRALERILFRRVRRRSPTLCSAQIHRRPAAARLTSPTQSGATPRPKGRGTAPQLSLGESVRARFLSAWREEGFCESSQPGDGSDYAGSVTGRCSAALSSPERTAHVPSAFRCRVRGGRGVSPAGSHLRCRGLSERRGRGQWRPCSGRGPRTPNRAVAGRAR